MDHAKTVALYALALLFAAIGLFPAYAAATDPSVVVIPWGEWVRELLVSVAGLAVTLASWAVARWAPFYVRAFITDKAISDAVNFALGKVEGAVAGEKLELRVTNSVIKAAADYAIDYEPKAVKWLGQQLGPAILAKLSALGVAPADAVTVPPLVFGHAAAKK